MARPRRRDVLGFAGALLAAPAVSRPSPGLSVVDMLGRQVALPSPPSRIVLLEANDILTMAMLHPRAAELIVGWAAVDRIDSDIVRGGYEASVGRSIPIVGRLTSDTLSLEGLLSLRPDLVVATPFMQPGASAAATTERLAEFGIPVLFSSSASNDPRPSDDTSASPIEAFPRLARMWGAVLDRPERAEALITFNEERHAALARRLAGVAAPKTYLEVMSLYDQCCWAAGTRVWGELLRAAGGRSLDGLSAPWTAQLQLEGLINQQPEVYIATGGGFASSMRPAIGPGLDAASAREGLRRLTRRAGFDLLPAVHERRVHGIWTGLITTPALNVVFVERVATWLHPERCGDIDPQATLEQINRSFLAEPIQGPLWASLSDG